MSNLPETGHSKIPESSDQNVVDFDLCCPHHRTALGTLLFPRTTGGALFCLTLCYLSAQHRVTKGFTLSMLFAVVSRQYRISRPFSSANPSLTLALHTLLSSVFLCKNAVVVRVPPLPLSGVHLWRLERSLSSFGTFGPELSPFVLFGH